MADANKTRGTQLLRTDDAVKGCVKFYDRRIEDVKQAFIGQIDVAAMLAEGINAWAKTEEPTEETLMNQPMVQAVLRLAVHGATQNVLDSSNKLEGDARVTFVRKACTIVRQGGWSSAPVDESKAKENAIEALVKLGFTREAAIATVNAKK